MQKLCSVCTIQQPLPVQIILTSLPTHISINSHPFPVGIVSNLDERTTNSVEKVTLNTEYLPTTTLYVQHTSNHQPRHQTSWDSTVWKLILALIHFVLVKEGLDYLTGQQVDVDGFHSSMETMKNVPIRSAYNAMDHPNGNTYILHAHEGLCFFDSMEHSLLPPAQLWDNNIQCDIHPKHCTNGESIF